MPFHIEVATARRHARSFNLTEEELGRTVLDPWLAGRPILLGDRRWTRNDEESRLRILEGPELSIQDLAFSQGWANAQRSSTDVTAAVLESAAEGRRAQRGPAAIVIHSQSPVQRWPRSSPATRLRPCRSRPRGSGSTAATRRSRP